MFFDFLILAYNKKNNKVFLDIKEKKHNLEEVSVIINTDRNKECEFIDIQLFPKKEVLLYECKIDISYKYKKDDLIFLNGFQSWSSSREFSINEKQKGFPFVVKYFIHKFKIQFLGDYFFQKYYNFKKGKYHGFNYCYIRKNNEYLFIGSLNEKDGYTTFNFDIKKNKIYINKDCCNLNISKKYNIFSLIITKGNEKEVFDNYFDALKIKPKNRDYATGWTSWYNHYTKISEEIILKNLKSFYEKNIPIDIFQIDDGYQKTVGDWLEMKDCFPNGMKKIATEIKSNNYKAGLWLAPFICHKKSKIFKEKKEWILKDKNGKLVEAGFSDIWGGVFYALDFYNNEVRKYITDVFNTVLNVWGFNMVKLDFLYAVALLPRFDKTKGQIMEEAMTFLNEIVGDKIILGCGVPLANAFGKVDYCRIGCDVALVWEDIKLKLINYGERVSTKMSITDTIGRRHLNRFAFLNDPDVFLLRNSNIKMNYNQKTTLFLINQILGGLVFTSDDISEYDEKTMNIYLSQFPFLEKEIIKIENTKNNIFKIHFKIRNRTYLAIINISNKNFEINLEKKYFLNSNIINKIALQPHQSICLIEINLENNIEVFGSTGHIFPLSEVDELIVKNKEIIIKYDKKFINRNIIYIKIPDNLKGFIVNGNYIISEKYYDFNIVKYST